MAFRALLFSKSPETNTALTSVCEGAGIRVEVCDDIFTAIKNGTQQVFSCVIADWSEQPEAGFLLKRARESGPNKSVVAIAIVDRDPTAAEMRDHQLEFLIYRPIAEGEAREVLAKASQKMQPVSAENRADTPQAGEQSSDASSTVAGDSSEQGQDQQQQSDAPAFEGNAADGNGDAEIELSEEPRAPIGPFFRQAGAAALVLATAFCLWNARNTMVYLARGPEGATKVLRESVAALFYLNPPDTMPFRVARSNAEPDADSSRVGGSSTAQGPQLGVVEDEADLSGSGLPLRKAADFPLPTPAYEQPVRAGGHTQAAVIPESLRASAPITPPVVVTVNPAQMMPVSVPASPPLSTQAFSEPVSVSEEAERALLTQSVDPAYPPEALARKLHGSVVLQATIGRDGSIEDLKIVRGNFVLAKAAIAAVKQWRFQPYTLNGRAAQTQTVITVNFSVPPG